MGQTDISAISSFFEDVGSDIYKECENAVKAYSMEKYIDSGVLVGLSGGADSVMLLFFLLEYRRRRNANFTISAAHINHGIRGEEADSDEQFCKTLCARFGVELTINKYDVPTLAKDSGCSLEETARNVRYSGFKEILQGRTDLGAIAVAHNMSDNAETVLFNALRGSGARGASGIRPVRDNIIRPLIRVSKADIVAAMDKYHIPYVTDSTNQSTDYTRNYIRHEIMPRLNRIVSKPENMLLRLSENLRSDDDYISKVASEFLKDRRVVPAEELCSLHYSVFVRVLILMADRYNASVSSRICSDIRALMDKSNFTYSLVGGATFILERGECRIERENYHIPDYRIPINARVTHLAPHFNADFVLSDKKLEETFLNVYKISIQANLSSVIINGGLHIRPKRDGDTIYYGGMTHKIKKLFSDAKIPISKRRLIPILCDDSGVVWVPGFGVRDDGVPPEKRINLYVLFGVGADNDSETNRLYSGSEFR